MKNDIANFLDATILKANTTISEIESFVLNSKNLHVKAICIFPCFLDLASELLLKKSAPDMKAPKLCTVIGFPFGNDTPTIKQDMCTYSINQGASEIDMVMNISDYLSKEYSLFENDIKKIKSLTKNKTLKVIIETEFLNKAEIVDLCLRLADLNVEYIKTSTGYAKTGAKLIDIELMAKTIAQNNLSLKIKASGGIKDYYTASRFIDAGASRIGTSCADIILS